MRKSTSIIRNITAEALALIIDQSLTIEQYIKIQRVVKTRGLNIYLAYNAISEGKKIC